MLFWNKGWRCYAETRFVTPNQMSCRMLWALVLFQCELTACCLSQSSWWRVTETHRELALAKGRLYCFMWRQGYAGGPKEYWSQGLKSYGISLSLPFLGFVSAFLWWFPSLGLAFSLRLNLCPRQLQGSRRPYFTTREESSGGSGHPSFIHVVAPAVRG